MSNQIKCYCKEPWQGLGRCITGYYKSGNRMVDAGNGRMELHRSDPICVNVYASGRDGTFYLDDLKLNRDLLRKAIIIGKVELEDLELQEEIVGVANVTPHTTIIDHVEKEVVVQRAGVKPKAIPTYGNMTKIDKSLNPKLQEELEKYRAKKDERQAARDLKKEKDKIVMAEYHENKKLEKENELKVSDPIPEVLSQEEIDDRDEKELRELMELEEKESQMELDKG